MKYCCKEFKSYHNFFISPEELDYEWHTWHIIISFGISYGINNCPWCGKKLETGGKEDK